MRRHEFDHVIAAAADVSGEREIVVIGSQAIFGSITDPPEEMLFSMEVDVYPRNDPRKAEEIEGSLVRARSSKALQVLRARRWTGDRRAVRLGAAARQS